MIIGIITCFFRLLMLFIVAKTSIESISCCESWERAVMSFYTLGLDLGVASIGWALISEDEDQFKLEAWGSRIFEQGLDSDGLDAISRGKGTSRAAERRLKKASRRQYDRRRKRKEDVKRLLAENGMLPDPLTPDFFLAMDTKLVLTFPEADREHAFHIAPYLYRKLALDRPLTKEEFGRAIYHLAQRRGYRSNRKLDLRENDKETGKVKEGISKLKSEMAIATRTGPCTRTSSERSARRSAHWSPPIWRKTFTGRSSSKTSSNPAKGSSENARYIPNAAAVPWRGRKPSSSAFTRP